MTPDIFHEQVNALQVGKRLPKAVYIHKTALKAIAPELRRLTETQVEKLSLDETDWDIAKFHRADFKLTLLSYPDFYNNPYPALIKSISIDLTNQRCRETCYRKTDNPPILHRKEAMVLHDDPSYDEFCNITQEGELAGLYDNSRIIGFKKTWESLIESKGYTLVDGRLFRSAAVDPCESKVIDRHKTALSRDDLSTPMKTLARHGYLNGSYTVFDYGCGQGDDLRELEVHGINAQGWDPNWRPDGIKVNADLVNLGFVINVIEDLEERVDALLGAWQLTDKLLVVAAMIASEQHIKKFKPYKDGVITSRNTFQKYFTQSELQAFIEHVLDEEPIAIGPGVFYIFKDKEEEQLYLVNKQRRRSHWKQLTQKTIRVPKSKKLLEEHAELFEAFWLRSLELGRIPAQDELECSEALKTYIGSPKQAMKLAVQKYEQSEFEQAVAERRGDLLIYFALQQFNKRKPYKSMPEQLKRDINPFFGNYRSAVDESRELLFSLAKPDLIEGACEEAYRSLPASVLNQRHSLVIHSSYVQELPIPLRLYIGCATQLYGETSDFDLIKIHIQSGKLTLMSYEGFNTQPIPVLRERIKINMRKGRTEFFDYGNGGYEPQPLYWKSRLIDQSFADYEKQKSFDKRLAELELPGMDGYGLSIEDFRAVLQHGYGLEVRGYRFYKA